MAALAREGASKTAELVTKSHVSLTGASGKTGLYYDAQNHDWYMPIGDAPSTHIVKQSHVRLEGIVTNEQLCLLTAAKLGITVPESFIIRADNTEENEILFATRRYDRLIRENAEILSGLKKPLRLHQEDFAQALGISSADKYEVKDDHYLKKAFRLLAAYSSDPINDQLKLWDMMIFDYLVGNTDNHIKNLSLCYSPNLKEIRLAPAYDIISTTIYESSTRDMAIAIGDELRIDQINRDSFIKEAKKIGLGPKPSVRHFDKICDKFKKALQESAEVLSAQNFTMAEDIKKRILNSGGIKNL